MIIVNFAHPLTQAHRQQIETITGMAVTAVHDLPCQLNSNEPIMPQVEALLDSVPLSSHQWQTEALLLNPPGLATAAAALLAELHGRTGHFPAIIRVRPVNGRTPPQYEVAEIINLQAVRDQAREKR